MYKRRESKEIKIGGVKIGGENPILIQSMTNTDTRDVAATAAQIGRLAEAGCEIARLAVRDEAAAAALKEIKKLAAIPIAADVHFDYRLALAAIDAGCDKLRLNPGNIGGKEKIRAVSERARAFGVPIRVGANGGSIAKDLLNLPKVDALVESALRNVEMLEDAGFFDIVIAVKSSSVAETIAAYRRMAAKTSYPLHVGVTETGLPYAGVIKSAVGIGALLADGIGDTVRVSLTADPCEEIRAAKEILRALSLRAFGVEIISCPTCGRTRVDLISLAEKTEEMLKNVKKNIRVAVMGCEVNGPGEARDADLGVACGNGCGLIFRKGDIVRKVAEDAILPALWDEVTKFQ